MRHLVVREPTSLWNGTRFPGRHTDSPFEAVCLLGYGDPAESLSVVRIAIYCGYRHNMGMPIFRHALPGLHVKLIKSPKCQYPSQDCP